MKYTESRTDTAIPGRRPRNRDVPPCPLEMKFRGVVLTCDLQLADHKIHHDPDGLWWTGCSLHQHREEAGSG